MGLLSSARRSPTRGFSAGGGRGECLLRDRISKIGIMSAALILYSSITLGLIVWNSSSGAGSPRTPSTSSAPVSPGDNGAWSVDSRTSQTLLESGGGALGSLADNPNSAIEGGSLEGSLGDGDGGGRLSVGGAKPSLTLASNTGGGFAAEEPNKGFGGGGSGEALDGAVGSAFKDAVGLRGKRPTGGHSPMTRDEDARRVNPWTGRDGEESGGKGGGVLATSPPVDQAFDVTLVSQTSKNRFWMLPFLCQRWAGPISIAILEEDRSELPRDLCGRMVISATWAKDPEELDPVSYPVNRLRNVAVDAVSTSHFLMTDIDIWPDKNAYAALHMRYKLETERLQDARNAIVFTAFSRQRFCEEGTCLGYARDVPETISELKPCLESGTCGRFDAANQSGQGTAYVYYWRSMLRQPNQRTLEHIVCFKSHRFEPYLVVRKSSILPRFDERFTGYGKNKIQWINHLRFSGFSFFVMPVNFVIHAPHPKSEAKTAWEKTGGKQGKGNKLMDAAFDEFMAEIREELADVEMTTELCQAKDHRRPKKI